MTDTAILVEDLHKSYDTVKAVSGLSLHVSQGEVFGFLGPNGAGKSTTISILATLITQDSGYAEVASIDVAWRPDLVRERIAVLFQDSTLDRDLTVIENLELYGRLQGMPRRDVATEATASLEVIGMAGKEGVRVGALSGGMRRRVELARAMLTKPAVLFLDEPTTGLDVPTRALVWEYLRQGADELGVTVFLTTHQVSEAEHCDRIMIIDEGRSLAEGTPERLRRDVGGELLHLETASNEAAAAMIKDRLFADVSIRGHLLEITGPSVSVLLREILDLGIEPTYIEVKRPTLDDVFMHHTGAQIRDREETRMTVDRVVAEGAS